MPYSRELRILHIASGDLWAGAETQLFTLAKSLKNIPELSIHIILFNHGRLEMELNNLNIPVTVLDEMREGACSLLIKLIREIRKIKPNVIHTHRTKENILGSIAAFLSGNIPSIRSTHGAPEHSASPLQISKHMVKLLDWYCGRFLQKMIVAVSDELATILYQNFPKQKVAIIENGVLFEPACKHPPSEKVDNIEDAVLRIGIAGRLVPVKRVDLFIKTAEYLKKHYPDIHATFHIYGDGPLFSELFMTSERMGLDNTVYFEGHSDNMIRDLQTIDILMLTSDHEGLPMILLEAMSQKTVILSHAVGGIPKLLDHGKCGLLVEKNIPEEYAREISDLAKSKVKRNNMINNAFLRVHKYYSGEKNAEKYNNIYQTVAS